MISIEQLKAVLGLKPLPTEGGYFAETYRSAETIPSGILSARFGGPRSVGTGIYYLLTPDTFSALHRLRSDEVYHFYLGDPVEMCQLWPDGSGKTVLLGPDLLQGMQFQTVVPQGVWQGSRISPGGRFALLGTTMAPGYDQADFEAGQRDSLIQGYPRFKDVILALTRVP
ncbi:MAG: cupin domain-containing protein [Nitrospirae bacterium]|nr:cupin domain-containing protein [Nitrospirota bacterium]